MATDEVVRLIELLKEHDLEEIETESSSVRIRVKNRPVNATEENKGLVGNSAVRDENGPVLEKVDASDSELFIVNAPIVGTVYSSPEPEREPFVEVGSEVVKGDILCLIEAMKLMNEIDTEKNGKIVSVFVKNGQSVQYGDPLFAINIS